jgi:DNA-binding SARP family transcriptional activator
MEFRVLGPTELWSAGRQCDLGPARERGALAILLLAPRTIVPAASLIDRLWDTRPPPKARESLSVYITRLRTSLRQAVGDQVRLAGRASGYVLDVDPETVDVHRFRRLRRQADAQSGGGDYDHAARLLREADGLWRGQALAGIRGDWVARMRDSLEEERRAAILQRVECELELGRHADLVGELHGLVAQYPDDETLIAHQMTALYRSGRPADALALYRETRARLADEQGTEPGPALAELHQRVLRNDPGLAAGPAAVRPGRAAPRDTLAPATLARQALPADTLARETLPAHALVPEMAQFGVISAVDRSYRELEPDHQRLFRRLSLNPCPEAGPEAAAALAGEALAETEKALAVLVDHHLLAGDAGGRFRVPDVIRPYAAARAAHDEPALEQRKAVGRLLDYYLDTADRADRVLHPFRHRMPVSVTRPPAAGPALGTPEDAAAWLESEWRNILQAARHAGRHEWKRQCADLVHLLAGFVEIRAFWEEAIDAHTLALQACRDLDDPARIAQAALELSVVGQQTGRGEAALALAEEAATIYRSLDDLRGLAAAVDQIGLANQRAARSREALAYFQEAEILYGAAADRHGEADTLSHSGIACWHLGRYADAAGHLRRALSLYRDVGDRRGEAKSLNNLGKMQLYSGRHRDALENFQRSLCIFTELGATQSQANLCHNIGSVYRYKGSYEQGLAAYGKALGLYHEIGDLPDEADVLNDIGAIYQSAECYTEALLHYERARVIAEDIGNLSVRVIALRGIADVWRRSGRYREALDHYRTALASARDIGDLYEEAKLLEGIAETTLSTQGPHAARIVFRQALDIFEQLGVPEAESARIRIETTDPAFGRRTS